MEKVNFWLAKYPEHRKRWQSEQRERFDHRYAYLDPWVYVSLIYPFPLGASGSVISGPTNAGGGGYPPTNASGQRICRQCGQPGRYKEGKCVEKWGPGPEGPGTVCDRSVQPFTDIRAAICFS